MTSVRAVTILTMLVASTAGYAATIERELVTVDGANDDYTVVALEVKKGDLVLVSASGEVNTGKWSGTTGPEGHGKGCQYDDTDGALIYKLGSGPAQLVGQRKVIAPDRDGPLKMKVRDTKYSDNSGKYKVEVTLIRGKPAGAILKTVVVEAANDEWTPAGTAVQQGDLVVVMASGKVNFPSTGRPTGDPAGTPCNGNRQPDEFPDDGALLMKTGAATVRKVGDNNFLFTVVSGEIKFRPRIDKFAGNTGQYNVSLVTIPNASMMRSTPSAEVQIVSLCNRNEHPVFSCAIAKRCAPATGAPVGSPAVCVEQPGEKQVAICQSGSSLFYRFGSRDKVELQYPESPLPADGVFQFVTQDMSYRSHDSSSYSLSFVNRGVKYAASETTNTNPDSDEGMVVVSQDQKAGAREQQLVRFDCRKVKADWSLLKGIVSERHIPREE